MKKTSKAKKTESKKTYSVLLASAECAPLSKTGGLADVVGTLPKSLKELKIETAVITPYHKCIKDKYKDKTEHLCDFRIMLGWRDKYVGVEKLELDGVRFYLIDNEDYFGDKIYRGGEPEGEQYAFFCRAVLEALERLDFKPDIIHCNDWHTAMLPMLSKTQYKGRMHESIKFILTIHNIAFQGKFSYGFAADLLSVGSEYYTPEHIEMNGCANFLKAGCVYSDIINTVSPTYADEIRTPYYGEGLEGILNYRSSDLYGILNGIDVKVFNPESDPLIPAEYSLEKPEGKKACKAELCRKMGLADADAPVIAMVTRMTEQKGFDLVNQVIDELMSETKASFMLLGTGDSRFEESMHAAEERWRGRLCAYIGYSEPMAHLIYAGSDFLLMPSRFEPCGLSQMIAMRYGTLPIVRETGGLKDSVIPYNEYTGDGTGFSFANYDAEEMKRTILYALESCSNPGTAAGLRRNAMSADFSFRASSVKYAELYRKLLNK